MQKAMDLESLLNTVIEQNSQKKDFLAGTEKSLRLFQDETTKEVRISLEKGDNVFSENFGITEHAHRQIANRLKIPVKHYQRLLADYPDLAISLVNTLFEQEPESRMLRTLNGDLRAFLSSSYKRLDNKSVLEHCLPFIVNGGLETKLLSSNITDRKLYLKVLFPDPRLAQNIGLTRDGSPDIVKPGFILSNSEIGQGSLSIKGFFYRTFCENGCHFGGIDTLDFSRSHLGGKVMEGRNFSIMSDETKAKEDELIIAQTSDVIRALASPEVAQKLGDQLRRAASTENVVNPHAAVSAMAKELDLRESEKEGVLESFIRDRDYSLWGMANAVTKQANKAELCSYDRATELEELGGKILSMSDSKWNFFAKQELVAA